MRIYSTPTDGLAFWLRKRAEDRPQAEVIDAVASESGLGADGVASLLAGEHAAPTMDEVTGAARALDCPAGDLTYRGEVKAESTTVEGSHTRTMVVASNNDVARDGDVVETATLNLGHYRSNPVVLWAHDYSRHPVGRADTDVTDDRLVANILWDEGTDNAYGKLTARQFRESYLNAVSLGWLPRQVIRRDQLEEGDAHRGSTGYLHRNAEVLEISAVPVPSLQSALVLGRSFGALDIRPEVDEAGERSRLLEWLASDPEVRAAVAELIAPPASPLERWMRGPHKG